MERFGLLLGRRHPGGQGHRPHRFEQLVASGRVRNRSERFSDRPLAEPGQRSVVLTHSLPSQALHERERAADGEIGRVVVRAQVAERLDEGLAVPPRRHEGRHMVPMLLADVQGARSQRGAAPLVEVAGPEIRVERSYIDLDHARRVRAVHHRYHAATPKLRDQVADRKDQARRRRDVIHDCQAGPVAHPGQERVANLAGPAPRQGDRLHHQLRPGAAARSLGGKSNSSIRLVRDEELVAGPQLDGGQDGADAGGRVRNEHQPGGVGPKEPGRTQASFLQAVVHLSPEERGGVRLDAATDLLQPDPGPRAEPRRTTRG